MTDLNTSTEQPTASDHRAALDESLTEQRDSFLEKLKEHGATSVSICYEGSGDSGSIESVSVNPSSIDLDSINITAHQTLADALCDFGDELLETYIPGYEINEGGHGTIGINVISGRIDIDAYGHSEGVSDVVNSKIAALDALEQDKTASGMSVFGGGGAIKLNIKTGKLTGDTWYSGEYLVEQHKFFGPSEVPQPSPNRPRDQ